VNDVGEQHPLSPASRLGETPEERRIQKLLTPLTRKGEAREKLLETDEHFRRQVRAYDEIPQQVKHLFARLWGEPLSLATHRRIAECMQQQYENWQLVLAIVWAEQDRIAPELVERVDQYRWRG
jgi:hypothetical protein